jgi:hypothetical protein
MIEERMMVEGEVTKRRECLREEQNRLNKWQARRTKIPTSYRHPGEKYQHGGCESVCLEHTLLTFPLFHIKVHPQMASKK